MEFFGLPPPVRSASESGEESPVAVALYGDECVLDAGCGTGRLTADLLNALPRGRVVGVDLSQNMLRSACEHLSPQYGAGFSLVACDLLHLPFKHAFDVIVSTAAFHWVLDHDQRFRNLRSALVPGGWLEAQSGLGPNVVSLRNRANALAATPKFAAILLRLPRTLAFFECRRRRAGIAACGLRRS
jgi:trans-aconitate 2-methyltransferase